MINVAPNDLEITISERIVRRLVLLLFFFTFAIGFGARYNCAWRR